MKVNNIVYTFRLQSTSFDKKSYLTYLKEYMGNVKKALTQKGASEDEVKDFQAKANAFAKKIIGNFKDYEFYIGESMNPDGMYVVPQSLHSCKHHCLLSVSYRTLTVTTGLSSSTTARTVLPPTSPSGSTVSPR